MNIAPKLKLLLKRHDERQVDMAKRLDCPRSLVSQLISGSRQPSLRVLQLISKNYSVPIGWLLDEERTPEEYNVTK